jgi:transposase
MRKGSASLSLLVQVVLRRNPLSGHLFCFRGRKGDLLKVICTMAREHACLSGKNAPLTQRSRGLGVLCD